MKQAGHVFDHSKLLEPTTFKARLTYLAPSNSRKGATNLGEMFGGLI